MYQIESILRILAARENSILVP
eukprot:COSAG02_NODE_28837_length_581_cov_1.060166_1_plen_21_part_01